jgi:hypothetical protein
MKLLLNHEQMTVLTGMTGILVGAEPKDSLTEITVEPWDAHADGFEQQYVVSLSPSDLQRLQIGCQAVIRAAGESNLVVLLQKGLVDRTLEVAVMEALRS